MGRARVRLGLHPFLGGEYVPTERKVMGFSSLGPRQTNQPWILSRSVWFYIFIPLFIPPFGRICILVAVNVFLMRVNWNSV